MNLSEIVRYRNHLDEVTPKDLEDKISAGVDPVICAVEANELQLPNLVNSLRQDREQIMDAVDDFRSTLSKTKHAIDKVIADIEPTYLSNSYLLYQSMQNDSIDHILNRRLNLTKVNSDYIQGRIQMFCNWKSTAAVIRPGLEPWVEYILGCDPLYFVDTNHALFEPVKQKFTAEYLNRLRFYTIKESDIDPMLEQLPDGQFSFILAYNFFHYKPFEVLKNYLIEIYKKLDSGGCLAFTFNDCDRWGAVALTERWFTCYTPGRLIRGLCENLGYEIASSYIIDNAITWLELRKPGHHVSLKGGQTLAKIIEKFK